MRANLCSVKITMILLLAGLLTISGVLPVHVMGETGKHKRFPLWKFDEKSGMCRAKGRLQDKEYCSSKMMDKILAQGKDAIPILISQLTGTRPTKQPIYDYWSLTTSGDVAYFILTDLFTDSDWKTFNMPGLEALNQHCTENAENCWRDLLEKHSRKFVQDQWLAAWNANKDRVYWNDKARCFRVRATNKE